MLMFGSSSFLNMRKNLKLCHYFFFLALLFSVLSQPSNPLYTSDYFLLPHSKQLMIPINESLLVTSNNGTMKYLKVTVKIQVLNANGTYLDAPFKTGNIMVKYWKNQGNTPASSVLSYSYVSYLIIQQSISSSKMFKFATDEVDQGLVDIEAMHNYENEHNFIHTFGNQISDTLFVLGIYRYSNTYLTELLGMTNQNDEIKISISVFKAVPSELKCAFCSVKTFCPTNQCECYQQTYSDCRVKRKSYGAKVDSGQKVSDIVSMKAGTMNYLQIQPENTTKQWFSTQISMNFDDSNQTRNSPIKPDLIYILMYTQNKSDASYMVPNIYNYDMITSPSLNSKITSLIAVSAQVGVELSSQLTKSSNNNLQITQKIVLNKDQILTMAVYYLADDQQTNQPSDLDVSMEMILVSPVTGSTDSIVNLAFVIGMIALGFFLLLLLICVLHFMVTKRFSIFSIFSNSQSSNRTSIYTSRPRSRKIANLSQQASTLPQISFDFIKQLVFKPLKYISQPKLQQKSNKKTNSLRLTSHDEICSICLQEYTNESIVKYTYCGHILDAKCLQSWFNKEWSCPMCRQKLEPEDIGDIQDKIMAEVWENSHYQTILDEQVEVIKRLYKEWQKGKIQENAIQQPTKYTEQSLVDNRQVLSNKYIQNTIYNISTMVQLQKTTQGIKRNQHQLQEHQTPEGSLKSITINQVPWIKAIFSNNKQISMKRFIRVYRFYRCIYVYHQLNKKFQKDSNMFEPSLYFEEKESVHRQDEIRSEDMKPNINANPVSPNICKHNEHDHIQVSTRKYMVRENQQANNNYQQQELQTDFNTEQKLKSTTSLKRIKQNKYGRAAFHLDFQFGQVDMERSQQPINQPIQPVQQQPFEPVLIRQATDSSQYSNAFKLAQQKRTKCLSMRQQMEGLERQLGQPQKKSQQLNEQTRFRDHQSVIFMQQDENARYIQALSPVVFQLQVQSRRQPKNSSEHKIPSLHLSRNNLPATSSDKKPSLSDNKK